MRTVVLRSALAAVSIFAIACGSGCATTSADEVVASDVSALTQWTTTVIDANLPGTEQIVECQLMSGNTSLFALNSDRVLWVSPVDHRSTNWRFQRKLPAGVKDLVCFLGGLVVLMEDGALLAVDLDQTSEDGTVGLLPMFSAPSDATTVVGTRGRDDYPALLAVTTNGALWRWKETESTWAEGLTFPYANRIAASITLNDGAGNVVKDIAAFAFDQDSDSFWYSDNVNASGAWERSSLWIPRDGSNPNEDLAISLYGMAPGRRMTGLYVLRNGKLYYSVP